MEAPTSFELYSTLPGKMARMEELLNAIDRFLDTPDFQDRLVVHAQEFHQLLTESRGLYPDELLPQDEHKFDQTIDQTAAISNKLLSALQASDNKAAREALHQLGRLRKKAHAELAY